MADEPAWRKYEEQIHAPRREFLYRPLAVTEPFGVGEVLKFDLRQLTEYLAPFLASTSDAVARALRSSSDRS